MTRNAHTERTEQTKRADGGRTDRCVYLVDKKMPLNSGESRGMNLAESISVLALQARKEANGGQSRMNEMLGVDLAEHFGQIRARVAKRSFQRVHLEIHGATGKGLE